MAVVRADLNNTAGVEVRLGLKVYNATDDLDSITGSPVSLGPGEEKTIEWIVPDTDGQPIQKTGIFISTPEVRFNGTIWLDQLRWSGSPNFTIRRPNNPGEFWMRAWVNNVTTFHHKWRKIPFYITQDNGEGNITTGTRDWVDYRVHVKALVINLAVSAGVTARVRGLNRYYALVFLPDNRVALIKARDRQRKELASAPFNWHLDTRYDVALSVQGDSIKGSINGGPALEATDAEYTGGGIGLVLTQGSMSAREFEIAPVP
jgi:hypothetical protein